MTFNGDKLVVDRSSKIANIMSKIISMTELIDIPDKNSVPKFIQMSVPKDK